MVSKLLNQLLNRFFFAQFNALGSACGVSKAEFCVIGDIKFRDGFQLNCPNYALYIKR